MNDASGHRPSGYYRPLGVRDGWDHMAPTEHTVSVWADDLQHGGPPSALLMRTIENLTLPVPMALVRITVDILGAVGLAENRVRAHVIRFGRMIAQVQAELDVAAPGGGYRTAARATAWFVAPADTAAAIEPAVTPVREPPPSDADPPVSPVQWSENGWRTQGFVASIDAVRAERGSTSPALTWLRPRVAIVEGESTTALAGLCCVADVANGLGSGLSPAAWTWMNLDTTIHLRRTPVPGWVGIDAATSTGPEGYGYTAADIVDRAGALGRSVQAVLLRPRG